MKKNNFIFVWKELFYFSKKMKRTRDADKGWCGGILMGNK